MPFLYPQNMQIKLQHQVVEDILQQELTLHPHDKSIPRLYLRILSFMAISLFSGLLEVAFISAVYLILKFLKQIVFRGDLKL